MKNVAKILILSICTLCLSSTAFAQCTPDPATPSWSIVPFSMDPAYVNVPFSQVLSYKAGSDTSVTISGNTVNVHIDSMKITGVKGLPQGFSYACHNASCRVLGGQQGCAAVTGTATTPGYYPLTVYVTLWGKADFFIPFPVAQSDSVTRYALDIDWATGMGKVVDSRDLLLSPNPASDAVILRSGMLQDAAVAVHDLQGREILRTISTGTQHSIDVTTYPPGLYQVSVQNGASVSRTKLVVR
jgi:hypothetical protein